MKAIYKILLIILAASYLTSCHQEKAHQESNDINEIKNVVQAFQEAYNQKDANKLSEQWAPDASFFNPVTGESAEGREEIEKLFQDKFADGKQRQIKVETKNIEFPNTHEAIEKGIMKIEVEDLEPLQFAYQMEYAKENGKWLIKAINQIEIQNPGSNFDQLKDLEWLIGKWEDADENINIHFDNQWDKYNNFITQSFQMKIYGQNDLEGKQIIAWDPTQNTVRSWVFDSDGEFGEGTWEKIDKSWYAFMRYTLVDGSIATAKNIYTPIDDKSYSFASVEREVDGEILPDMDPVTVKKIE